MSQKGVFRRYNHIYYVRRVKLPLSASKLPVVVSRSHPSKNRILRDGTFRGVNWVYYARDRRLSLGSTVFTPGVLPLVSKVHPSKNRLLRDSTFRPPWLNVYQPRHVLPPSQFVPGITNAVQLVHPSRNPILRDNTFRPPWLNVYQPKRVLPPSQFVPGFLPVKHPRLRAGNFRQETDYRYYRIKRILPFVTSDVVTIGIPKNHPSRNALLRQRPSLNRQYYQQKHPIYPHVFVPGVIVLVSRMHPSRNMRLRDKTFRPDYLVYYQPKHVNAITAVVTGDLAEVLFRGMWRGMYRKMR